MKGAGELRERGRYEGWEVFGILLGIEALTMALLIFDSSLQQRWVFFGNKAYIFSVDFVDFYRAAIAYLSGLNPYEDAHFNKPPWVVLSSVPFTGLTWYRAACVFFALNLLSIFSAILVSARGFLGAFRREEMLGWSIAAVVTIGFSYPCFFVLDRGNLDGLVTLFCTLYFVWWSRKDSRILAGIALGVATCLKIYPALLIVPAAVFLEYQIVAAFAATLAYSFLTSPKLWLQFITNTHLVDRLTSLDAGYIENGSLANTFSLLAHFFTGGPDAVGAFWDGVGWAFFASALLVTVILDFRLRARVSNRGKVFLAMSYVPLMLTVPRTAYLYEYVNLLPWAVALGAAGPALELDRREFSRFMLAAGILLGFSQFQAVSFFNVLGPESWRLNAIPGFSLFLLCLLPTLGLRWLLLRSLRKAVAPDPSLDGSLARSGADPSPAQS